MQADYISEWSSLVSGIGCVFLLTLSDNEHGGNVRFPGLKYSR